MKIDEHLVKLSVGRVVIPDHLDIDDEVALMVKGTVTKDENESNNDGTVNRIVTVKGFVASVIYKEKGEVVTVDFKE